MILFLQVTNQIERRRVRHRVDSGQGECVADQVRPVQHVDHLVVAQQLAAQQLPVAFIVIDAKVAGALDVGHDPRLLLDAGFLRNGHLIRRKPEARLRVVGVEIALYCVRVGQRYPPPVTWFFFFALTSLWFVFNSKIFDRVVNRRSQETFLSKN